MTVDGRVVVVGTVEVVRFGLPVVVGRPSVVATGRVDVNVVGGMEVKSVLIPGPLEPGALDNADGTEVVVVEVVVEVVVVDVVVVDVVEVVPGGNFGPVTRGVPMNSKCMPSAMGKVPPHANPCRRNTSTMRSSMVGALP
jgi:hypothetical protein